MFLRKKIFLCKKKYLKTQVEIVTSKLPLLSLAKVAATEELLGQGGSGRNW